LTLQLHPISHRKNQITGHKANCFLG
jgi:hypothetical protein